MKPMKVSESTITALQKVITGDPAGELGHLAPYRSGPQLIAFFNQFGALDQYGNGFPSRWAYAEDKLRSLNGMPAFIQLIEAAVDPRPFISSDFSVEGAVDYLNQYLRFDGYRLEKSRNVFRICPLEEDGVRFEHAILEGSAPNVAFMREQIAKCRKKIAEGDHDGAITNARSLLEAVLLALAEKVTGIRPDYDGDLIKLYKTVRNLLNLEPSRKDISDSLKQVLTGIISIVGGLAPLRNKMSDAHARTYKPSAHHAKLTVNSVYTISLFLLESFEHQCTAGGLPLSVRDTAMA